MIFLVQLKLSLEHPCLGQVEPRGARQDEVAGRPGGDDLKSSLGGNTLFKNRLLVEVERSKK
jgi:hypothetical protein